MDFNRMNTIKMLPKQFWERMFKLLQCDERVVQHQDMLIDDPDARTVLIELTFFPETLN